MTTEELKQLITDWARIVPYTMGNAEDSERTVREAVELIDCLARDSDNLDALEHEG
jgi:ABC-type transporter Mla subunit MlaD